MKRFYNTVGTRQQAGAWQVTLDGRGLKTVRGADQRVPTQALAKALSAEWNIDSEELNPGAFPMRDMADYAIDVVVHQRAEVAHGLVAYADTDTLLYRADPEEPLYQRQRDVWEPIVTAFEEKHGVALKRVSGVVHAQQDQEALATIRAALTRFDPFALAGLEAMTRLAASLTIGLSALDAEADPAALWRAACLEEEWQADHWGRDDDAEERRIKRRDDFLRACEFARLSQR